ncbi:putative zinc metalloprotease [Bacillus sp. B-jedd]|nr:putative zinc metalloprotease [Bacillus sp. B-jedd]
MGLDPAKGEGNERADSSEQGKRVRSGRAILYLGRPYPTLISQDANIGKDNAVFEEDKLHVYVKVQNDTSIKQALKWFYYQECKALVEKRVKFYQS